MRPAGIRIERPCRRGCGGILTKFLVAFGGDERNEFVEIVGRSRCHHEDLPGLDIDDHEGTTFASFLEDFLGIALPIEINGGNHVATWTWPLDEFITDFVSLLVEDHLLHARGAGELVIEDLLKSGLAHGGLEKRVAVIDRAVRKDSLGPNVADEVGPEALLGVVT